MRKLISMVLITALFLALAASKTHAQNTSFSEFTGKIAYIGIDGNLYVLTPSSPEGAALTMDGTPEFPYEWPTWSTDGRLAYFVIKASATHVATDIHVTDEWASSTPTTFTEDNEAFTYAYWSPKNCDDGSNCRNLAVLLSDSSDGQLSVKLIRDGGSGSADHLIGMGAPFYYSWSPNGTQMLWQRNNDSIDIYDVNSEKIINTLPQHPGYFQTPAWSPTGNVWLFGALGADQQSTDLVAVGQDNSTQTLASQLAGPISFSWSPDGSKIAYVDHAGGLFVLDARTGKTVTRSAGSGVYAFFWSPDGTQIAYITLATDSNSLIATGGLTAKVASVVQDPIGLSWSILDATTGATQHYGAFIPTDDMVYLLSYFDQFSQSHRIWSPDSRYLIYSEVTSDGRSVISLLDTNQSDTVPLTLAEGSIAIWSFS